MATSTSCTPSFTENFGLKPSLSSLVESCLYDLGSFDLTNLIFAPVNFEINFAKLIIEIFSKPAL